MVNSSTLIILFMRKRNFGKYNHKISSIGNNAAIISKDQWKRIKKSSIHMTAGELLEHQKNEEIKAKQKMELIRQKRENIYNIDYKKQIEETQRADKIREEKHKQDLAIANSKAAEEIDQIKTINTDALVARVRTIQESQMKEKEILAQKEKDRESEEFKMLEAARLDAVATYEERERNRREQLQMGRKYLEDQIEDRRRRKAEEQKAKEEEQEQINEVCLKTIEEDKALMQQRKKRERDYKEECLEYNRLAIKRKQEEREKEWADAQRMIIYQMNEDEKFARQEAEKKRQAFLREQEIDKLRKQQQKIFDDKAYQDELRARRVQEENNRKEMQKELDEQEKKRRQQEELRIAREEEIAIKKKRAIYNARLEKEEFEKTLQLQRAALERYEREQEERRKRDYEYREYLKKEIEERRIQKKLQPLKDLDEQQHIKEANQDFVENLEKIRELKLQELRNEGVPEHNLEILKNRRFVIK